MESTDTAAVQMSQTMNNVRVSYASLSQWQEVEGFDKLIELEY
jgi:hypothetical protein